MLPILHPTISILILICNSPDISSSSNTHKKEADFRFVVNNVEVEGDGQKEETPDNKVEEDKKKGLDNTIKNLGFFRKLLPNLAADTSQHQEVGSTRGVPPPPPTEPSLLLFMSHNYGIRGSIR